MNTFYLGNAQEFDRQADEYLNNNTADQFKVYFTINQETNQQAFRSEINK